MKRLFVFVFVFLLLISGILFGADDKVKAKKGVAVKKEAPAVVEPVVVPVEPVKTEPVQVEKSEVKVTEPVQSVQEVAERKEEKPKEVPKQIGLRALVLAGGSLVTEDHTGSHGSIDTQMAFGYELPYGLFIGAGLGMRFSDQEYVLVNPAVSGGVNQRVKESEQSYDTRLFLTYNALSSVTDAAELKVLLALRYIQKDNDAFAEWSGGVQLGLEVVGYVAKNMYVSASGAWSMAAFGTNKTISLLGLAKHYGDTSAAIGFKFPGIGGKEEWNVELRWAGTVVVNEHSTRFYNGALAGLGVRF